MSRASLGPALITLGVLLLLLGALVWLGALAWFGRLPGDIRIERPNLRFYFPFTSMVLISVILSLVLAIARRIW